MLAVASVYCNWSEVEVGGSSVGSENFQTILAEKQKTVDELSSQLASKDLKIKQLEERIEELGQVWFMLKDCTNEVFPLIMSYKIWSMSK